MKVTVSFQVSKTSWMQLPGGLISPTLALWKDYQFLPHILIIKTVLLKLVYDLNNRNTCKTEKVKTYPLTESLLCELFKLAIISLFFARYFEFFHFSNIRCHKDDALLILLLLIALELAVVVHCSKCRAFSKKPTRN